MKGNKGERWKNEWEISERDTEHERLLSLGNEVGGGGRGSGWGWLGDGHWVGHLSRWALGVIVYVGKVNTIKNKFIIKKVSCQGDFMQGDVEYHSFYPSFAINMQTHANYVLIIPFPSLWSFFLSLSKVLYTFLLS